MSTHFKFSLIIPSLLSFSSLLVARKIRDSIKTNNLSSAIEIIYALPPIARLDPELHDIFLSDHLDLSNTLILYDTSSVYEAMNAGILSSSGAYLFFCGDTDVPYLLNMISLIDSYHSSNIHHIIIGQCLVGTRFFVSKFLPINPLSLAFERNDIHHQSILYHRSIFSAFGLFSSSFRILGDYCFHLRLRDSFFKQKISHSSDFSFQIVYTYHVLCDFDSGGLSGVPRFRNYLELYQAKRAYLTWFLLPFAFLFSLSLFSLKSIRNLFH